MSGVINRKLFVIFICCVFLSHISIMYWNGIVPFACIQDGKVVADGDSYTCESICYNSNENYKEVYENGHRVGFCLDEKNNKWR